MCLDMSRCSSSPEASKRHGGSPRINGFLTVTFASADVHKILEHSDYGMVRILWQNKHKLFYHHTEISILSHMKRLINYNMSYCLRVKTKFSNFHGSESAGPENRWYTLGCIFVRKSFFFSNLIY